MTNTAMVKTSNERLEQWKKERDYIEKAIMHALLDGKKEIEVCQITDSMKQHFYEKNQIVLTYTFQKREVISKKTGKNYNVFTYKFEKAM